MNDPAAALLRQDDETRRDALSLAQSFLIQAPAGSGKTGLLVQRLLALLAHVDRPEAILAITFTRKAAQEMRHRVLAALAAAADQPGPDGAHPGAYERTTHELARRALARDQALGWQLHLQPERLQIHTIDAFNQRLVRRLPLGSGLGALPATTEQPLALYQQAADWVLEGLKDSGPAAAALMQVQGWVDNDPERLKGLLIGMLGSRERWQHLVLADSAADRRGLEAGYAAEVLSRLTLLERRCPKDVQAALLELLAQALVGLRASLASGLALKQPLLLNLEHGRHFPRARLEELPRWQALAELLLTQAGDARKRLTIDQGFPPGDTARAKQAAQALKAKAEDTLRALSEFPELVDALHAVRGLPKPAFSEAEWATTLCLLDVLRQALAALRVVMIEAAQVDFPAVATAALTALGSEAAPTDLGLALDSRIQHLLVDEFQDTSVSQFALLCRLLAGWTAGDGRSLFLVGDPMQSIYRFREADVGLFLQVAERRQIAGLELEYRQLTRNFRSVPGVVEWVNKVFARLLPAESDLSSGRIGHVASVATRAAAPELPGGVQLHLGARNQSEADLVVLQVQALRVARPQASVAVLGRTRKQLAPVLTALRQAGLAPVAVGLDCIANRPVVADLLALARALDHPADRLAWLAVLRAPYVGLDLAALTALTEGEQLAPIAVLAGEPERLARLSPDMRQRLERALAPMLATHPADATPLRLPERVRSVWYALGGPACVAGTEDLDSAEAFFDALVTHAPLGGSAALNTLEAALDLAPVPTPALVDQRLQIMTMHKAKGLEFDCVFLVGLTGAERKPDKPLLYNLARPRADGRVDVLLCPLPAARGSSGDDTARYALLRDLVKTGDQQEAIRLLYVAATRAREQLHICISPNRRKPDGQFKPRAGSLLATLLPGLDDEDASGLLEPGPVPDGSQDPPPVISAWDLPPPAPISRLASDWAWPPLPATVPPAATHHLSGPSLGLSSRVPEFDWAGQGARAVGIVVHGALQAMADDGLDVWDGPRVAGLAKHWRAALRALGVPAPELRQRQAEVQAALTLTLGDVRGRWCLSRHACARSEWALGGGRPEERHVGVIDRYFEAEGQAWIIDFKTSSHSGGGRDSFLDNELARYRAQLEAYAVLARPHTRLPIRLGLYFPLLGGWREWAAPPPAEDAPR